MPSRTEKAYRTYVFCSALVFSLLLGLVPAALRAVDTTGDTTIRQMHR